MATYAIGDIQGCYQTLQKLLKQIGFTPTQDKLWLAGDLINRGPRSLDTLNFIYDHQDVIQVVLGNHDLHFLAVAAGTKTPSSKDTFTELLAANNCEQLCRWLSKQPLFHYDPKLKFAMVHAGIYKGWDLAKTQALADEVSVCLQSDQRNDFFQQMYGNQPSVWNDQLAGMERLRFITNTLTRIRYCYHDGQLDLIHKTPLGEQPSELTPWFDLIDINPITNKQQDSDCTEFGAFLIFGHWAALNGQANKSHLYALDTGCVWGGKLTAFRLEDKAIFQQANID
jgi:bis(5'-nucleosyl)-tetraphosphatase (symmetrical)